MHDCVVCGCACYCHGDIDDCQVETVEYSWMHCEGCGCGEEDFDPDMDACDEPATTDERDPDDIDMPTSGSMERKI